MDILNSFNTVDEEIIKMNEEIVLFFFLLLWKSRVGHGPALRYGSSFFSSEIFSCKEKTIFSCTSVTSSTISINFKFFKITLQ